MSLSFWGGASVHGGQIRRLNASSFRELVDRYITSPVQLPMTRKDFWALPRDKDRDAAKDGAFVCACTFAYENEGHRSDENATRTVLTVIDLDEGEWVRDFDENPDTLAEHLYPYSFVAWRTAKYRAEAPRLKVMVEVSPCHPQHHRRLVSFIASRLGLPRDFKGVRESKVLSQPQYRPVQFRGEDFTAVIASNLTGLAVNLSDLPEIEPEDQEMLDGRTYACDPGDSEDDYFGLAYLPVADLSVEDISEALSAIDPDSTYKVWIEVAAALRHQFTDEDDAREAYEKFVEWSSQGTKFQGRRDCWTKWKSFRPYAKGRAPVTIRTLYKHAMDAGWDNVNVAKKISKSVEDWFVECTDKDELMQEGAKRIAAMPFKNDVIEEALIIKWRQRIKALTNESIDKLTLKKEITRVRRADKKAKQDSRGKNLPPWLVPMVYVATSDTFNNLGNGVALRPGAFDRFFAQQMMPKDDTPANGMPVMSPSAYALNILGIRRVEETLYDPTRKPDEQFFTDEETGKLILNTYNHGSVPVPDPEFAQVAEQKFRQLIEPLAFEPWLRELLIDYSALQVQCPGVKIPWSFLFQSAPGVGKGTFGEVMEAVLGPVNVKIISPEMMKSGFSEWARNCVLGVFNEVYLPGDRRDQVMNSIKPLISDPTIPLTVKHKDAEARVKNFTNYIGFTNYKDACHIADNDRRWCIVYSPYQTREQVMKLSNSGHFEQVRWLLTPEGASALRYFLSKRKISEDFPLKGHAPSTRYREEVIEQSKNYLQVAVEEAIEDRLDPLIGPDVIHDGRLKERVCRTQKDASLLSRYLALIGFSRYSPNRVMVDGVRGHIWTHAERWTNGVSPVEALKQRLTESPELSDGEEPMFE